MLVGVSFATQAQALVLCTSTTGVGSLQVREACNTQEVQIDPADLGLDDDLAVYDSNGVRVGKIQGILGWGANSDSRAVVAFDGNGHTLLAVFVWSTSGHALNLCLPQKRFCWKYN